MRPICDSLTSVVSSPRADVRCETRPDVDGGNAMAEKDKTQGWARVKTLPSLPVFWVCLEAALVILWFDFAYRMTPGPVYTLPISILNHPRGDAGWLAALAGTALAAFAVAFVGRRSTADVTCENGASRGDASSCQVAAAGGLCCIRPAFGGALHVDMLNLACALGCFVGPALVKLGSSSLVLTVVGGLIGGLAFGFLAPRLVANAPVEPRSSTVLGLACASLGACAAIKLLLGALNADVCAALVCILPILGVVCEARALAVCGSQFGMVAGVTVGTASSAQSPAARPSQLRSHLTEIACCSLGLGLYMGLIGFSNDGLAQAEYVYRQVVTGVGGTLLACALLFLSMRANPDAPYVVLPILLGTSALVFILTTTMPSDVGQTLAHIAGKATDSLTSALAMCAMVELLGLARRGEEGLKNPAWVVCICSFALFVGILGGGVLMSTVGLGTTSIVLVAVSLLYGALLSLGVTVQQRARDQFVIVRNPADMARIAQVQADAIAAELGTLTPRETEVLPYLLQHQSADAIAEKLGISRNTVKTHTAHIYEKAGVNTRAQLVDLAATKTVAI